MVGYYENYYITENIYTVEILNLPQEERLFRFYYTELKRGDFTYTKSGQSDITGTFTVDDNDFQFDYDGSELTFSMEHDLREKSQTVYPQQEIKNVSFFSKCAKTGE